MKHSLPFSNDILVNLYAPLLCVFTIEMASRNKTCTLCSEEGHSLIDCPNMCNFCGDLWSQCDCNNSSLVETVKQLERSGSRKAGCKGNR